MSRTEFIIEYIAKCFRDIIDHEINRYTYFAFESRTRALLPVNES